jgi:hypothetical protein
MRDARAPRVAPPLAALHRLLCILLAIARFARADQCSANTTCAAATQCCEGRCVAAHTICGSSSPGRSSSLVPIPTPSSGSTRKTLSSSAAQPKGATPPKGGAPHAATSQDAQASGTSPTAIALTREPYVVPSPPSLSKPAAPWPTAAINSSAAQPPKGATPPKGAPAPVLAAPPQAAPDRGTAPTVTDSSPEPSAAVPALFLSKPAPRPTAANTAGSSRPATGSAAIGGGLVAAAIMMAVMVLLV